jgi:hypothetical protein
MRQLMLLTIWATALFGTVLTGNVFAQETTPDQETTTGWLAKPVQCGPPGSLYAGMEEAGLKTFFGGLGTSYSRELNKTFPVYVYLSVNLENQQWVAVEINEDRSEACIVGVGTGTIFDTNILQEFTAPESFQ